MSNKLCLVLSVLITASLLLVACAPATTPVQPTTAPSTTPTILVTPPDGSSIKVGLVTNPDSTNDRAFNQLAWVGIQKAAKEMGIQTKLIESKQPGDDSTNIDALANEGYNVIITVGSVMGDVTALKAKQYPNIKFAIVNNAYTDSSLPNITSLMFAEEQASFLAGVLAGGMSKSGFVCSVSSLRTPASDRSIISFHAGATWQAGSDLKIMNNYINIKTTDENVPTFNDSTYGKETALRLIANGCDVLFAVGDAVDGALLAADENNLPAIGADVDLYNIYHQVQSTLISSTMKNVDVAVYNYLKAVADGSVKAGISLSTLQNGGVGLAPFHDWESKIPADLKAQIQKASDGIKDGSIKIDLPSDR